MTLKINQELLAPKFSDGISAKIGEAVTSVTIIDNSVAVRRARLTLTALSIAVTAANDYGGSKIVDLPDSNILILACEADLVITKAGTTNGMVAATDLNVGIGTAVASAQTLATTMQDILEVSAITDNVLAMDFEVHSAANSTTLTPRYALDAAGSALYLNIGIAAGITANDTAAVTGIIDIFYMDVGNLSS